MSSLLTNTSSMVALQTLRGINQNLSQTQSEISTGKSVGSAKDNSALWSISKVMESDVKGFMGISASLSLGEATVSVARQASETVTDLLTDMKGKIVAAQEENVDRNKIQTDIDALSNQIKSVVDAAQFNGLSLVKGQDDVNILASLDRSSSGTVTSSDIAIRRADLSYDAGVYGSGASLAANVTAVDGAGNVNDAGGAAFSGAANTMDLTIGGTIVAGEQFNLQIAGTTVSFTAASTSTDDIAAGLTNAITSAGFEDISASVSSSTITISSTSKFDDVEVNASTTSAAGNFNLFVGGASATGTGSSQSATIQARASEVEFSNGAGVANTASVTEGDGYRVTIGSQNFDYIAGKNETFEDVANGLKTAIDAGAIDDISTAVRQDATTGNFFLQVDNDDTTAIAFSVAGAQGGTATGGLFGADSIDVTTDNGVEAALSNIETLIDTSIEAAADFGSAQGRLDTQSEFITNLSDSLKAGIGSLVDADMEAVSARLQALQVQQQLAVQALSIANQAPQSILSLFR